MICPVCVRLRDKAPGDACLECGASLLPLSEPRLSALVEKTLQRRIEDWRDAALIDEATAQRLEGALGEMNVEASVSAEQAPRMDAAARAEEWANGVVASVVRAGSWRPSWGAALAASLEETAKAEREQAERRRRAPPVETAAAVVVVPVTPVEPSLQQASDEAATSPHSDQDTANLADDSSAPRTRRQRGHAPDDSSVSEGQDTANLADDSSPPRPRRQRGHASDDSYASEDDLGSALGSGQALFARDASGALGGGLEAVVALDATSSNSPRLNDFIWWFLGAVLVLGGSLMGVREAWQALGGVPRQLLVTGALWGYHAGFIGLGVFLSRRSLPVGRVLSGIGLALLPVSFVALSSLVALSPGLGIAVSLGVAIAGLFPLRAAGRLLHETSVKSLAVAMFPALLAGLPLMGLDEAPWLRMLCASAGVASLAVTLWLSRTSKSASTMLVSASASLYSALWLTVFSVASAPSGFDAVEPGSPMFAGLMLWAQALAAVIALATTTDSLRKTLPRMSAVLETVAHAVLASGAIAGALSLFSVEPGEDFNVAVASALTPVLAAVVFFWLEPRRLALAHLGVMATLLAGVLVANVLAPIDPGWWVFGGAVAASGLLLAARRSNSPSLKVKLLTWGIVSTLVAMPLAVRLPIDGSSWPRIATGLVIALTAHLAGGWRWRGLHYLGGVAATFCLLGLVDLLPMLTGDWGTLAVFAFLGGFYGVVGLLQAAWARPSSPLTALLPLDDLSLGLAATGVFLALVAAPAAPDGLILLANRELPLLLNALPTALTTVWLLLRARRDGSRVVGFFAATGLALAVSQALGTHGDFTSARAALVSASLVLGFALVSALRPRPPASTEPTTAAPELRARKVLDLFRLPLGEHGLRLYTDGFAAVACVLALVATLTLLQWQAFPTDLERSTCLLAGGLLTLAALVAFVSRGFVALRLRGSVVAFAAMGGFIALTAIVNRAGRPLAPDIVALRHPLVGIALWGLSLALGRVGPWIAERLEKPQHGRLYQMVPRFGVVVLVFVLLKSAFLVGLPTPSRAVGIIPPLMVLGAAVLVLLLAGPFRQPPAASLGLALGLPGAALWAARESLRGPSLVSLLPPNDQWVRAGAEALDWLNPEAWLASGDTLFLLWQRAFAGVAAAGLVYALAAIRGVPESFRNLLRHYSVVTGVVTCLVALFQPGLIAAALVCATGIVLFLGGARAQGRGVFGVSLLLLVHAAAHRVPVFESWPGPVLALVGLALVTLGPWVIRKRGLSEGDARVRLHQTMALYLMAAMVYALAVGRETSSLFAAFNLAEQSFLGLGGTWLVSPALPVTWALIAASLLVAAFQWKGALAAFLSALGTWVAGAAVATAAMAFFTIRAARSGMWLGYGELFTVHGAELALAAAGAALVIHSAQRWLRERRGDVAGGMVWGRDIWLVMSGLMLTVTASSGGAPEEALSTAIAALGLAVLVALHCAWTEHTGRHVYFVQLAVVGTYALVRSLYAPGLRAEHDALFALALGFVLVGVTVQARRAGVRPVEAATRRFAALLPIGMAFVLPGEATQEAALLAGGSGLLYAALGAVERSRMFGAFAAAACNFALLISALAFGLEGLEIYLAPLGLLLLMLGQLFTQSLPHAARNTVRILGGLLLYVPAAAKLAMRVGESPDGMYALIFGGVCLLGVVVGMLLQIRAYLALGTLFLTLDVVANLLGAGLRDHRIGFLVMTLTGLTLIGGRVLATLKRREWELLVRKVRVELQGWD
ncbi:hypothetical protein MYSTI_07457 [Myxococcus stipitatus DSM 14675]|uniref:Uncharacterized protein n=1 Tax=Myxococcus stipitatus (strain DSM 14675 / JCM 12634 / Mx s8) TaxID=1278073 RepID=L7UQ90_MYXSD|nr:hypothetical protein MYSTI_07457 [Myxococcus stipitatus DSM 14675]